MFLLVCLHAILSLNHFSRLLDPYDRRTNEQTMSQTRHVQAQFLVCELREGFDQLRGLLGDASP